MKPLIGDARGMVTVIFTTESLPYFVELMNLGSQAGGSNVVFGIEEFAPGQANIMWTELDMDEEEDDES